MSMDWNELESTCKGCKKCPLGETRTNCVFGVGNKNAALMFVGEAPGADEDRQGEPFVGAAGKHFNKFLQAVGIERGDVYIANILKCRPPNNRDPLFEEQDACMDWLRAQVKLIKPKIIVCLGRISAMRLIDPDFKITKSHGEMYKRGQYTICAVYHPSALLRDPRKNEDMYRDMKKIKELIEKEQ